MASNVEKYFLPVTVGAAIVAIWAALRKPSQAVPSQGYTTAGIPSQGVSLPAIPALTQYLAPVGAPQDNQSAAVQGSPTQGTATNPLYVQIAGDNPAAPNPFNPAAPYSSPSTVNPAPTLNGTLPPWSLTYNQPPNLDWFKSNYASQNPAPEPASKPGGGCGGCSGGASKPGGCGGCAQRSDRTNARFSDGRGGCLSTRPEVAGLPVAAANTSALLQLAPPRYSISRGASDYTAVP